MGRRATGIRRRHGAVRRDPDAIDRVEELFGVFEARGRLLLEHVKDERLHFLRNEDAGCLLRERRNGRRDVHAEQGDLAVVIERALAGEHLVGHHAERIDVRAGGDVLAERLLGRHVFGRSVDHTELRERLPGGAGSVFFVARELGHRHFGDAEVEHFDEVRLTVAIDEHHVLGLEIAVHDSEHVRALKCSGNLTQDAHDAADFERPDGDGIAKAFPFDVLEHEKERAVFELPEVGRGRDIGMIDVRGRHRLAFEAGDDLGQAAHFGVQYLHC